MVLYAALIRVSGLTDMEPLPVMEEEYLEVGEEVMAVGSPQGLENTVTTGIVSGVNRDFEIDPYTYDNVYQISAPIAGGSSGGPLVERSSGKVAGINSAGMTEGDIGFSIPINDVLPMLKEWSASPMQQQGTDAEPASSSEESINQEEAVYVVGHYFDSLNVGDYQTAYSLLSESWKQGESLQEFRERNADLGFVEIQDVKTTLVDGNVKVMFALAEEDTEETLWYQATYTVSAENSGYTITAKQWELVE
ncbi:S1C family serine protease [Salibacterium lacus]|uniref:S1C family serine protease n=1 Tax=Salibacterium lacus TaxID=1898109 RepID=A0ABW5T5F2_9BACI